MTTPISRPRRIASRATWLVAVLVVGAIVGVNLLSCGRKAYVSKITEKSITAPEGVGEIYYSDYFSFQGADESGPVLLAVDNNRWKNDEGYAIDHFLSLYRNGGWHPMVGNKRTFPHPSKQLVEIPDDEITTFRGTPRTGLTITSKANDFVLAIEPLKPATVSKNGFAQFTMLSAPATLTVAGQQVAGRVIEEYLVMPHFSKKSTQFLKMGAAGSTFTGLYLTVEGRGDLYLHRKTGQGIDFIGGRNSGFLRFDGLEKPLSDFDLRYPRQERKGFFSFPMDYAGQLSPQQPKLQLRLHTVGRHDIASYVLAGFAMAAVEGTVTIDDKPYQAWGFAELIE